MKVLFFLYFFTYFSMKIRYILLGLLIGANLIHLHPVNAAENPVACTMEYAPVCALVEVQCITAPCNPVNQTFGNACMARAQDATIVSNGECSMSIPSGKMSPQRALRDGTWTLESFDGKAITEIGTITFSNNRFHAKLCNTINGRYVAMSNRLILRNAFSTKMYCDSPIMSVENALVDITR